MKKKFEYSERRGLPGGPNETFSYTTGVFSTEGYKRYSPDVNNPFNIIPSGNITMKDVDFPVEGTDNLGNSIMMKPGYDYKFPGNMVFERPIKEEKAVKPYGSVNTFGNMAVAAGGLKSKNLDIEARYAKLLEQLGESTGSFNLGVNAKANKNNYQFNINPNITLSGDKPRIGINAGIKKTFRKGGGLLTKSMKCNNCGWSWRAVDGGKDATTCHKCGGSVLPKAQEGREKSKGETRRTAPTYILPEVEVQAFPNATPAQKEALSTGPGNPMYRNAKSQLMNNKQAGNFANETADAFGYLVAEGPMEVLQTPQSLLVEGIEATRGNDYNFKNAFPQFVTDATNKQRLPSQTFLQNAPFPLQVAGDIFIDPFAVVGAAKGGINAVRYVKNFPKAFALNLDDVGRQAFKPMKSPSVGKGFKSEINWGKWNKEIPENKALMDEYAQIESTTKADGTWMKNPDGSDFTGVPEQFIQQQSKNFKKSFGNTKVVNKDGSANIVSHTTDDKFDEFSLDKFGKTDDGFYGKGIYFGNYLKPSQSFKKKPYGFPEHNPVRTYGDIEMPSYVNISNPIPSNMSHFFGRKGIGSSPEIFDGKKFDIESLYKNKYDGVIVMPDNLLGEYVTTPNNIKAAVGNNGMFDMTNPNIYKSVAPLVGAGVLGSQYISAPQEQVKYQQGGGTVGEDNNTIDTKYTYPDNSDQMYKDSLTLYNMGLDKESFFLNEIEPLLATGRKRDKDLAMKKWSDDKDGYYKSTPEEDAAYTRLNSPKPFEVTKSKYDPTFAYYKYKQPKAINQKPKLETQTLKRKEYIGVQPNFNMGEVPELKVPFKKEPPWYRNTGFNSQPVRIQPSNYDPDATYWRGEPFQKEYKQGGSLSKYQNGNGEYIVQAGNTFDGIANKLGINKQALRQVNPGIDYDDIKVDQVINVPDIKTKEERMQFFSDRKNTPMDTKDSPGIFKIQTAISNGSTKQENPSYNKDILIDLSKVDKKELSKQQAERRQSLFNAANTVASAQGNNKDLEKLLVMSAVMENTLGIDDDAYGRNYTRGPMSIDDIAYKDLFEIREGATKYTTQQKKNTEWLESLGINTSDIDSALRSDDPLTSMAVARLVYGRAPEALPSGDDPDALYNYYLKYYNKTGVDKYGGAKAHRDRFNDYYDEIYKELGGEVDEFQIYANYINGSYDGTEMETKAEKIYDKLNRVYYRESKNLGMSVPNYIMTNIINRSN